MAYRTTASLRGMIVTVCLALLCVMQLGSFIVQTVASSHSHTLYRSLWEYAHIIGDLPELLSSSHGPNSTEWNNSVAICATMKQENATDVREWLLYYQWLGVDHVYLSENADSPTATLRSQLDDFVRSGFVTYATEPMPRSQLKVYYDCMRMNYNKHNWLAFIDIDEFLVLMSGGDAKLPEFLDAYRHEAGLSVHWVLVGPSGHRTRPESGGVLRHYPQCAREGRHMVKTIANTFYLANIASHPHNFEFRDGRPSVDELMRPVPHQNSVLCRPQHAEHSRREAAPPQEAACHHDAGFLRSSASVSKVALFHYATKSKQDFEIKVKRGSAMRPTGKPWSFFDQVARMAHRSGGMCDLPAAAAAKCCPPDALVLPT